MSRASVDRIDGLGDVNRLGPPHSGLSLTAADLLSRKIECPPVLIDPWLRAGGLAMVHAWRGVGKTHFGIGVGFAAATASKFLRWQATAETKVLYVDGEMPAYMMAERLRIAMAGCNPISSPDNFRIITPDALPDGTLVPNLLTSEGQRAIEPDLEGRQLVVLDNFATLFRTGDDHNAAGSWLPAQDYILSLRRRGIAVLLIDHDNKSGGNRGSSAKEDVLDTVIQLKAPADYLESQGARFEVHFKKHRHFQGRDAAPFEAQLETSAAGTFWTMKSADDAQLERYVELVEAGVKERDIREELGCGGSTITKLKSRMNSRGKDEA